MRRARLDAATELVIGETPPVLWHFPVSHFNEKARWALDWKNIAHRRQALFLDYIPRAFLKTRQLSLPILLVDGRAIADSTRIIAELERRAPEPPLYPADPALRERALVLEEYFDEELGHCLRTLAIGDVWERDPRLAVELLATGNPDAQLRLARAILPLMRAVYRARHRIDPETRATARRDVEAALERLEREIGPEGYLAGDSFSVADLSAAALLGVIVRPPELEYPIAEERIPDELREYQESLAKREAFAWVREIYARHRSGSAEIRAPAARSPSAS